MEQMTRLDIDPRGFIIFPFGGGQVGRRGGGVGGIRNFFVFSSCSDMFLLVFPMFPMGSS
jgi:hypothetical protein